MSQLISVIVPIYNVEKYICKCVDSLINQTYKNLEIILVDDGSPDNCPQICDEYSEKDNRIKVVHKKNGGLSDARNAGMKMATGEYISFIDSDDYVSYDFIETLYNVAVKQNSEIVECDLLKFNEDKPVDYKNDCNLEITTYETEMGLSMLIAEKGFHQHVWNKLYKADIALKIYFKKGKINEDEFWTYQIFGQAKRISKINKVMYYYLQRSGSIMGNSYNLGRLDALEAKEQRQVYIEKNFLNLSLQSKIDFFAFCIFSYQLTIKFLKGNEKKKAKKIIKYYVSKCKLSERELNKTTGKSKFWFKFANISFEFCCKIRNILGIGF